MPRIARLDAPGVLHHVMIQGIERRKLFRNNKDREDFIKRLEILLKDKLLNFKRASRIQLPRFDSVVMGPTHCEPLSGGPDGL